MSNLQEPYAIEERRRRADGTWARAWTVGYAANESEFARSEFAAMVEQLAQHGLYAPHGDLRLVLLGPDRTVLPAAITEGPAL